MNEQIEKYFLGELTSVEKEALFKEMTGNPDARDEFAHMQNSWALAVSLGGEEDRVSACQYWQAFKKRRDRKQTLGLVKRLSKYAAIFVVGVLITKGLFFLHKPEVEDTAAVACQKLVVPAGQHAQLTLADGTTVWVNAKSTLEYPEVFTGDTRELTLSGEAYFEVAENPSQPFIVKSGDFRTQVTGTQFNVFAYDGSFDVSLIEGQVKVYRAEKVEEVVVLNRHEKVTLVDGRFVKTQFLKTEDFLWKEGVYSFDDKSFAEIFARLQLYYGVQIHVNNTALLNRKYTGKFRRSDDIESLLKVIQMEFPFVFTKSDDGSNIYIK